MSKKSPLKIGDRVRISLHKRLFEKGSTANWSEKIFRIVGQEIYRIDRVVRKRKMADGTQESLVRWSGYPNKFDSWMPSEDVIRSRNG